MTTPADAGAARSCLNCGAPLGGPFCPQCGQRDRAPDVSFGELVHEGVELVTNVDSVVVRSFAGLLRRPGQLTVEYLAGRRARFLPPLRLYLLCSLAFVLADTLHDRVRPETTSGLQVTTTRTTESGREVIASGDSAVRMLLDSTQAVGVPAGSLWERLMRGAFVDPVAFRTRVRGIIPKAFFLLVPVAALLLSVGFRTAHWAYVRHLVVALHLHASAFLAFAGARLVGLIPLPGEGETLAAQLLVMAFAVTVVPRAVGTVYGVSPVRAGARLVLIGVPYAAALLAASAGALVIAALSG